MKAEIVHAQRMSAQAMRMSAMNANSMSQSRGSQNIAFNKSGQAQGQRLSIRKA